MGERKKDSDKERGEWGRKRKWRFLERLVWWFVRKENSERGRKGERERKRGKRKGEMKRGKMERGKEGRDSLKLDSWKLFCKLKFWFDILTDYLSHHILHTRIYSGARMQKGKIYLFPFFYSGFLMFTIMF